MEDLERLMRVEGRDDLRERAEVAVDELAEPTGVVERARARCGPATKSSNPGVQNVFWTSTTTSATRKRSLGRRLDACCSRQRRASSNAGRVVDAPHLADAVGVPVRRQRERLGHAQ